MASLDPTARKTNIKDSLKKFFVNELGVAVTFDPSLASPRIQGREVDRWVVIGVGPIAVEKMSALDLRVFCCTKMDNEGFKLAQLRDAVLEVLIDTTKTDGMKRIPFYRSFPSPTAWELIGALLIQQVSEAGEGEAEDGTKYTMFNVRVRWESRV